MLTLSMLLVTGCWDMLEVDQRLYPYSVGYDLVDEEEGVYNITMSYPNLGALGKNAISEEKVHVLSTEAFNIFDAIHKLTTRVQYQFSLKHLKVAVLSETVGVEQKLMKEMFDGLYRDFTANKNVELLLVKGSAESLIDTITKSKQLDTVEGVLNTLLNNAQDSTMFIPKSLGEFILDSDISGASIIPIATANEDEVEINGGGIFKDYTLIGYIDGMTNRDIAYLRNETNHDGFRTVYNGADLTLMLSNITTKPKLVDSSNNLKIRMDVELEAYIHSYIMGEGRQINTKEILEDMQNHVAKEYEEQIKKTINIVQKQYKADLFKLADYLRKFHQKTWREVGDKWEEIYPEIDIDVDVTVFIRRRGLTK
ncbi:Ger(x)C family spore germination protein [Tissierella sp. Yu-01]|uniref:Ger(x)C family spore germination protein n=1 Tax=Tissierella sp. Yu-01 TaxID=3035694 RepID=UPI00240D08BF|nr:Ger(x)C family spore germination protein [Tissierella sp. Yu-01]WFA10469.1 Ger(x)C family spore germination protein [Tissierella sp. Yu-01]